MCMGHIGTSEFWPELYRMIVKRNPSVRSKLLRLVPNGCSNLDRSNLHRSKTGI